MSRVTARKLGQKGIMLRGRDCKAEQHSKAAAASVDVAAAPGTLQRLQEVVGQWTEYDHVQVIRQQTLLELDSFRNKMQQVQKQRKRQCL
jgi:hypothetical protein